jgi:hypothetical protein
MAWTLNSIRIIVQDNPENNKQIIARLQPVSGGTVLQVFGYEDNIVRINGIVVGTTDKDALLALSKTGNDYTLVTPYSSSSFYVNSVSVKQRLGVISQTILIDATHDCDDPIFDIDIELYPA